jgi:hypothetical protein
LSWVSGISVNEAKYRRIGDSIEVTGVIRLSGAPTTAALTIQLPSGISKDTSKIEVSDSVPLGSAIIFDSSPANVYSHFAFVTNYTTTAVKIYAPSAGTYSSTLSAVTQAYPLTFAVSDEISYSFKLPVVGWSSSQVMSSDADTRVVALHATLQTSMANSTGLADVVFDSSSNSTRKEFDTNSMLDTSTGIVTVKVAGKYRINVNGLIVQNNTAATRILSITDTANSLITNLSLDYFAVNYQTRGSATLDFKAGEQFKIRFDRSAQASQVFGGYAYLDVERLSGPSQIAASESVSALYTGAPPTGTLNSSPNVVTYGTKVKDSHNAYSGGVYTIPVSGTYDISALYTTSGTYALNDVQYISIYIDGVEKYRVNTYPPASISQLAMHINVKAIPLLSGQAVAIRSVVTAVSPSFDSSSIKQFFSITRSGNY